MIAKLLPLHSGTISLDNIEINNMPREKLFKVVSYVGQFSKFIPGTVLQNICLNNDTINDEKLKNVLSISCFNEVVNSLTKGLDTYINSEGQPLSSGEQQILCLARALYSDRTFLVLDEALSAVDIEKEKSIFSYLKNYSNDGKCIIIITHNITNLQLCDEILLLERDFNSKWKS